MERSPDVTLQRIAVDTLTVTHICDGEEVVTGGEDGQAWVATFASAVVAGWFIEAAKVRGVKTVWGMRRA